MRPGSALLASACSLLLCAGCATPRDIYPSASSELALRRVHDTLVKRGFRCSLDAGDLTCEGDRTYKVVMEYLTAPNRLLFYAWFETERPCVEHAPQVMEYNTRYLIQLSCVDDMLRFFSSTYVPEAGLNGAELEALLVSWSDEIHATATEAGLFEPGPSSETPPPEAEAAQAQTL